MSKRMTAYWWDKDKNAVVIKASQTEKYHESRKVRTTLTVYRLQCSRGHISTSWFSHAALASRQWKELVDEYKGKDTK